MVMETVTFKLPKEILSLLGSPDTAPEAARKAVVIELFREGRISQGKAAELLGISRWEMIDLVNTLNIPTGPQTAEDIDREVETIRRLVQTRQG